MSNTPMRGVRVPDDVWDAARAEAQRRKEPLARAIVRLLRTYGKPRPATKATPRKRT
jgi:hypothetical protein